MHVESLIPNNSSFLHAIFGMRRIFSDRSVVKVNCRQSISRITNEIGYPTHLVNVAGIFFVVFVIHRYK